MPVDIHPRVYRGELTVCMQAQINKTVLAPAMAWGFRYSRQRVVNVRRDGQVYNIALDGERGAGFAVVCTCGNALVPVHFGRMKPSLTKRFLVHRRMC